MWVHRNKETGKEVEYKSSIFTTDERCRICGQPFREKEMAYLCYVPFNFKTKCDNLNENFMVHPHCWKEFIKDIESEKELADKLLRYDRPRKKSFTEEEKFKIECFKQACLNNCLNEIIPKPYGLRASKRGTSLRFDYNVYQDNVEGGYNGRTSVIDRLQIADISARLYNETHKLIGDNKTNNFSSDRVINKAVEETNKMLGIKKKNS